MCLDNRLKSIKDMVNSSKSETFEKSVIELVLLFMSKKMVNSF